jgi:2-C-methyl-D-erythritol 4-phosphate cytidylyltransferase/2-C-methyl-D-erythritol 2,4-cyclodiphosphate synthase
VRKTDVIVVAAGRGTRLGGDLPKQYRRLAGRPVLRYSLEAFTAHPAIRRVVTVIHPEDRDLFESAGASLDLAEPVPGGDTRQESVRRGLESLENDPPDQVLIHDAARPFLTTALIDRLLGALEDAEGALPALPVVDSLKRGADGYIADEVDREGLWRAQTPQAFRYGPILAAHRAAGGDAFTDDAAVARTAGLEIKLVPGSEENVKVTESADLDAAERRLQTQAPRPEVRVGQGFDVHRFTAGDHVTICGLRIESFAALAGHSDADVGLHAITDAVLGALAAGDIGRHFPPSDPRWADADSAQFLAFAGRMIEEARGRILHLDVTVICEEPRIGPHREAMRARIAEILSVEPARVSVKATTTERLGFTGRKEGIAAQAVATIELPGGA